MIASVASDSRRMQRRDSSVRSSSTRRPRLLRATATEPSITTSNASPNALATQPGRRATELLSRVAFVSGSPPDSILRSPSLLSTRSSVYDGGDRHSELSSSPDSNADAFDDLHRHPFSGRYFSFPSFDLYEASQQDDEKSESKSP
ncbi:hypothetical protein MYCTH_2314610 [Thermothelomyces thermophilus ATCC 42464]|uniref:Uncharacterized protein n=1 Tax=Thermothelomyces thermophilus (strain ATCC 42464 / BCRC 31852 / DSM 1799) TaxID=573729 RepID=G2Q975_THET4|nr:uncharacterized protein MYCTH_2314610 [Thermothelomyces thermophilus ATCC 42464]AEO56367.1 hypothetical protein MYCTH_2314610 [Thermothelomyces thermophilus ATCC 42464]